MPPKPKFSREEIVSAALDIVTEHGPSALTARALGAQLGSSARPIFTVFENMEEVSQQVRLAATRQFQQYVRREIEGLPHFKAIGMNMVCFAMEKPRLFQLLYMQGNPDAEDLTLFFHLDDLAAESVATLRQEYGLDQPRAEKLFQQVWIHTYGVSALCAGGVCRFTQEEVSDMLTFAFQSMLSHVLAEK